MNRSTLRWLYPLLLRAMRRDDFARGGVVPRGGVRLVGEGGFPVCIHPPSKWRDDPR